MKYHKASSTCTCIMLMVSEKVEVMLKQIYFSHQLFCLCILSTKILNSFQIDNRNCITCTQLFHLSTVEPAMSSHPCDTGKVAF